MHVEIRGLERLSFRERQAVILKESGNSIEKIARILKISTSSVSTILARAKTKGYQIIAIIPENELGLEETLTEERISDESSSQEQEEDD
ncbi:RNA polymerase, sigma-24 subunit, ECF subfamily [Syntrophobotulus glycolicus DSM 8271]|uniref:RNA polymerase, sigma-24 subunit, ECF subfamily n=1 Tax=Syntrophobotulus glycolicus (strain DSM 8271 / FlGlyR) TaxID=645991 RepID=F0SW92_SYNGF|nr:sigma factor-like helix-turn-helix DNA-binding protein [Syntrophobotulus glycolicus]ADY54578.1 RNA polymerase, sigma-24 subunit, ECF subfamily [Syntrophobotulus glycolicus DSM 8271]